MNFDTQTTLKDNARFYSAKVSIGSKAYFYKKSKKQKLNVQIEKQVKGAALLNQKIKHHNVQGLQAETIVEIGEDWLLAEWLDNGSLAEPADYKNGKKLDSITALARIQIIFDELASTDSNELQLRAGGSTLLNEAEAKQKEKLEPIVASKKWDKGLIEHAIEYWVSKSKAFKPALQHGDLTPWHIYKEADSLILIDCEHVAEDWPRYYDIANFYSALNTRFKLTDQATKMLVMFSEARQIDLANNDAFKGIVVLRNIFRLVEHQHEDEISTRIFRFTKGLIE